MPRGKCLAFVALLLTAAPALAQDFTSLPNDELCIAMAVGMIQGDQPTKDAMRPILEQRGETCAPAETYLKIAEARLQFIQAQQAKAAQDAAAEQQRKADRDARIRSAGQAWLIYQAQQDAQRKADFPKTTRCNTFEGMTTCHTN